MPFDGLGAFTPKSPEYPAVPNTDILASDINAILVDLATGLSSCITRAGLAAATADIPFGGNKLTGVATGTNNTDATNVLQVFTSPSFANATNTGTTFNVSAATFNFTGTTTNIGGTNLNITATNTTLTSSVVNVTTQSLGNATTLAASTAFVANGLALKANLSSPTFTDIPRAPTATVGTLGTQIATMQAISDAIFAAAVPVVIGDANKVFGNDGSTASWTGKIVVDANQFIDLADATKQLQINLSGLSTGTTRTVSFPNASGQVVLNSAGQTLSNKVIPIDDDNLTIRDNGDTTKTAQFQASGISTGTQRVFTFANNNAVIDTPGWNLLAVSTASGVTSHNIEWTNGTYNHFVILAEDMSLVSGVNDRFVLRMKIGGTYLSTNVYNSGVFGGLIGSAEGSFNGTAQSTAFLTSATIQTTSQKTRMKLYIDQPGTSLMQIISGNAQFTSIVPSPASSRFNISCGTAGIMTGVQIRTQLSNNLSGTFRIFGIRSAI